MARIGENKLNPKFGDALDNLQKLAGHSILSELARTAKPNPVDARENKFTRCIETSRHVPTRFSPAIPGSDP
jgi:hypothetical protein